MPIAYPFPPHLQQQINPAQEYARGLQIGAQAAQAQAALQAQREANAQRVAIQQQELEQQSIKDQQRLLVEKAYNDARIGLEEQQVRAAQQLAEQKTKAAAIQFQYQQRAASEIAAGADPSSVWMKYGPLVTGSLSGVGSLMSASKEQEPKKAVWIPDDLKTGAPGHFETPSGSVHIPARTKDEETGMTPALRAQTISYLKAKRKELTDQIGAPRTQSGKAAWEARTKDAREELKALDNRIENLLKPTSNERRVKVTTDTGRKGTIPESQLPDLPEGWKEGW